MFSGVNAQRESFGGGDPTGKEIGTNRSLPFFSYLLNEGDTPESETGVGDGRKPGDKLVSRSFPLPITFHITNTF